MQEWLIWFIAFIETSIQWLSSTEILGVSILGIMAACVIIPLVLSLLTYRG